MISRKRFGFVSALAVSLILLASSAGADPITPPSPLPDTALDRVLHVKTPFQIISEGGTNIHVPPGYVLNEPQWGSLDTELRRLQDAETRLSAENDSLRDSAGVGPWTWIIGAASAVVGIILGAKAF